jgi:predicted NBD/HSP70 family sugar kinase
VTKVLVVDVGGTNVKVSAGRRVVKIPSGSEMTASEMARRVRAAVCGWEYDVVSIGFPGVVLHGKPASEPRNLGTGWVGFNYLRAFGHPVKIINDAAMQAWGSYRGGRMLFLGLGTGLGTALIVDGVLEAMEFAHLPYRKGRTYEDYVGKAGLKRLGKRKWRKQVLNVVARLKAALEVEDVVLGGGNAKLIDRLPRGVRRGDNSHAQLGGRRLWRRALSPRRKPLGPATTSPASQRP